MAGAFILRHAGRVEGSAIRDKGLHDLVTFVDEEAERIISAHILEVFPDDEILGEETATENIPPETSGRRWIVDPLDGTTNFIHCVPPYAVSIALQDGAKMVVGVVYDVPHNELFAAESGQGLTKNGRPARVSNTAELGSALIATGFPFRTYDFADAYLQALEPIMRATRGIRRHGAASVDLAWVACGRFDGFFEAGLAPWDMAAGFALVQAGGGRVSGLPEGSNAVFEGGILACTPRLYRAMHEKVAPLSRSYGDALVHRRPGVVEKRDQTER